MLAGTITGILAYGAKSPDHALAGAHIVPQVDAHGNYTQRIEITLPDGVTFTLAIMDVWIIEEEIDAA